MTDARFPQLRRLVRTSALCGIVFAAAAVSPAGAQTAAKAPQKKSAPAPATPTPKTTYSAAASKARRVRLASARARAREMAVLAQPRFKVDADGVVVPDIQAEAAIIYNPATGQVLWEEKAFDQRSIASITKVMTAVCFLEDNPDLSQDIMVERADTLGASTTYLRANERVSVQNLLHLLLIASDNAAARTLARVSPYGSQGFVVRMNEKAVELGLESTHYSDPSGLLEENVSSAFDMAKLIAYAAADEFVSSIMRTSDFAFRTSKRALTIHSTNQLLRSPDIDVRGGKTGFIARSGYCLATLLRLPDLNQTVAVVVLGAKSNAGRFWETRHLFNWIAGKTPGLLGHEGGQLPIHQAPATDRH
ncbi:MAG: serine hydrolase [Acidobacteria bacterium]|nr:serine hydrolase [Acidobacteriota bacterium]